MSKKINLGGLGGDRFTTVSEEDYEYLSQWKWRALQIRNRVYAVRGEGKNLIYLHRVVLFRMGEQGDVADHRHGNGLNNTRENLRGLSFRENAWNRGPNRNNRSGFKGVSWDGKRWATYIQDGKQRRCIGRFDDKVEAAKRYNEAVRERIGEVGWLNPIPEAS